MNRSAGQGNISHSVKPCKLNVKRRVLMLAISAGILSYTTMPLAAESWTYTYNTQGQVLTSDGPRTNISDVTTNTYDSSGNLATSTNALGQVTQSQNYNGRGQPGTIIDPNGIRTELTYSPRGWLLNSTIKDPSNNVALDAVTTFGYDNVGQVISITLADDSVVNYEYDGAQRLVAISNALGERMEYTLDAAGNRTLEVVRDATSIIVKTQARVYDELSRLIQTIGADNQTLSYAYDVNDNIASVTDGKAQVTAVNYDALDRLITETDPDTYNVGYTYDAQDVIQTVIDQRGLVTTYHHNGLGYLTSLVSPDTGTTVYTYDDAGNRTSSIDSRGAVANYSYDALNRLISVSYPNSLTENVTYSYDSTANGNNGIGRLTGITDDSGTLNFTYDHLGNVIAKSYSIGGTAYTSGYTYDLSSNITQIIYSSGRLSSYTRDGQGRVTGITTQENSAAPTETVVSNVTYLPFGPIKSYTYGNGIVHNLNYDQDYRIVDNEALGTSSTLDLNYSYDANNNIATIVDQSNTLNDQRFQYDSIDRIEQADGNYGQLDYQYDGTGNRTQKTQTQGANTTTESYSYGATNNRLDKVETNDSNSIETRTFQYDASGNLIQDTKEDGTVQQLTYNEANRYVELNRDTALLATYRYNVLGQRTAKTASGNTTISDHYHYDEAGQLIGVTTNSGIAKREYIYLGNIKVAALMNDAYLNEWDGFEPAGADADSDGIPDNSDNCPNDINPNQTDIDNDTIGNVCDPIQLITSSIGTEDGWVRESGENTNIGGSSNNTATGKKAIRFGDNKNKRQIKAILSFDLSAIPANATLTSASLQLTRTIASIEGIPSSLGASSVDVKAGAFNGNPAIEIQDFEAPATQVGVGSIIDGLTATASIGGTGIAAIQAAKDTGETKIQLRLQYAIDDNNDATKDYTGYYSGSTSNPLRHPILTTNYTLAD